MLRNPGLAAAAASGPSFSSKSARKSASSAGKPTGDSSERNAKLRRGSTGQSEAALSPSNGVLGPNVVTKTWQQQVERITAPQGSVAPSLQGKENRFRSTAVYCEVKLREMLLKGKKDSKAPEEGKQTTPDAYRTAVCCQLLSELCEMRLPFSPVLTVIRDELARSIYSDCFASQDGSLAFEQIPFFQVVTRLEGDKAEMEAERERWKDALLDREKDMGRIEGQMQALEAKVRRTEETNAGLRAELQASHEAFEGAKGEVRLTRDEMKHLRKELLRAKEEVQRALAVEADCLAEREEFQRLRATQQQTVHELQRLKAQLELERRDVADCVPKKELDTAQMQILDLQTKLAAAVASTKERRGELTPRPLWSKLRKGGSHAKVSTADQATELCVLSDRLSAEVDGLRDECARARVNLVEMTERLKETECLLPPDVSVMPAEAGAIEEMPTATGREADRLKVLGRGPELPRCLRSAAASVRRINLNPEVFLQTVMEIWDGKAAFDAERPTRSSLPEYLYAHLRRTTDQHSEVVEWTYSMLHTLQKMDALPPAVEMFKLVLFGELSEDAYRDLVRMSAGLQELLRAVARSGNSTNHTRARTADCLEALDSYFPEKDAEARKAIHKALRAQAKKDLVVIDDLFSDVLQPSGLLGVVVRQYQQELRDYTARLRAVFDRLKEEAAPKNGQLPINELHVALERFDASKPVAELEAILAVGCNCCMPGQVAALLGANTPVKVGTFAERLLRHALVKRTRGYDTTAITKWRVEAEVEDGVLSDGGLPETA